MWTMWLLGCIFAIAPFYQILTALFIQTCLTVEEGISCAHIIMNCTVKLYVFYGLTHLSTNALTLTQ